MSTSYTHDLHEQPIPAADQAPRERSASPWSWAALAIVALSAMVWWLQQRPLNATDNQIQTAPVVITPETSAPAAVSASVSQASNTRAAPVPLNREAQALAGNADPVYPRAALRAGVEGSVLARLNVDSNGNVSNAAIIQRQGSRDRLLDRAVLDAVNGWHFAPAMREGRAIASVVQVPVDFRTASH